MPARFLRVIIISVSVYKSPPILTVPSDLIRNLSVKLTALSVVVVAEVSVFKILIDPSSSNLKTDGLSANESIDER